MTTPDDIALPEPYDILAEIHGDELAAEEVEVPVFTADQLRTAVLEDRKRMYGRFRRVFAHEEMNHESGNAPNHSHAVPGIWDSDNGHLAGKKCEWCALWNEAVADLSAAKEGQGK